MNDAQSNGKRRPALVATAPIAWRSHSAPPRKKWYRRGPQLLNRQRSTTQQSGSMLYDQMVARRLVGAIAAWHDLHASLLQLSLRATDDDDVGVDVRRRAKRGGSRVSSRASSICSSVAGHGRKKASVRRVTSRTASGRRKCQRQTSARRSGRNRLRVSNSRGPSPRSSFSAGSARSSSIADGGVGCGAASGSPRRRSPRTPSRSSSGASGGSSSGAENHRGALTVRGGGPSTSSMCSSSQLLPCWRHRHDLSPHDFGFSNSSPSSSLAVAAAEPRPTAATWSATFAQSLQIRRPPAAAVVAGGSRKTARSSSNCDGEEIVLKHHVKLLEPVVVSGYPTVQHQCARCCLLPPSSQPMLLSPPSTIGHHYCQRRCFSVSKVDLDVPTSSSAMLGDEFRDVHRRRMHHRHRCSCGEEEGDETADDEHDDDGGEEAAEDGEDELDDSASSDGAVSDTELDALVADEKHRPKLSLAEEPELSPEQLRQLFPELSEHWRRALAKSPVVKRAAVMQEQELKRVSKHRTSRYWLEDQLGPSEHIWLTSSASASSTVDTECYLGEKDCQKMGEKRRCSGCHIVAHTACFPLLAKMNLSCKTTFRDCAVANASGAKSPLPAGTKRQRQGNKGELCSSSNELSTNGNNDNNNNYKHHWVHRWRLEGRCSHCGKSFQQKMFREKEVIAITCSWCKRSYHNKRHCFSLARFDDHCDRGVLRELILPPGWLLRLSVARKRSANASGVTRALSVIDSVQQKRSKRCKYRTFVVKPPPASAATSPQAQNMANTYSRWSTAAQQLPLPIQPLLVFVNPKSGGNKGAKALNMLCWLLNPRQVFDINVMRGPKYGLDMFRKVHSSMRILVCGGDGTVGWVLSTLDLLGWPAYPPIALLPLGTGNDLSRAMGWGGTFSSDEPLAEVLAAVQTETSVTHLDRWRIDVCPLATTTIAGGAVCNGTETENNAGGVNNNQNDNNNSNNNDFKMDQQQQQTTETSSAAGPATSTSSSDGAQAVPGPAEEAAVQSQLPLSVMNNYFSIGADAHVALQFHQSRSANPQMLNSRLKNRIAYGGLGTIDLFKRTWKDLSEYISVECDGVDISAKIREFKFHCVLFHNIAFYAGGTVPWGAGDGVHESCGEVFSRPSPCDGKIEVLGFTTATLAALQMGGKGERIAQCSKVRIETSKPIPMQVDGEPCLLGPSLIHLTFHNKVSMLRREKFARPPGTAPCNNIVSMGQNRRKSSQNSSANSSIAGGAAGGAAQASTTMMTTAGANGNGTVQAGGHKNSRANASPEGPLSASPLTVTAASPPTTMLLDVPVIVVGRHDYDTYRDSVERLKDTGFELGILNVEAETELAQLRQHIQQMMCEHQILPYDPGPEWRFLDYVSSAEEGTFRVSRHQEQCRTVADVCSLEQVECRPGILILDDAFPSMNARAAAIGHELVFTLARKAAAPTTTSDRRNTMIRRRISETLRIVLANDAPETHL